MPEYFVQRRNAPATASRAPRTPRAFNGTVLWRAMGLALIAGHAEACCGKRETAFQPSAELGSALNVPSTMASVCGIPLSEAATPDRCDRSWSDEKFSYTHRLETPAVASAWATVTLRPGVACGGRFTMEATSFASDNGGPPGDTSTDYTTTVKNIRLVDRFVAPVAPPGTTPLIPGEVSLKTFRRDECPGGSHTFAIRLPARQITVTTLSNQPSALKVSQVLRNGATLPMEEVWPTVHTFETSEERTYQFRVQCAAPFAGKELSYYLDVTWGLGGRCGCAPAP